MTQFEIIDLFKLLGFKCLEDNVGCEVNDYGYYARFGNDTHEVQFRNRDGRLRVHIVNYQDPSESIESSAQMMLVFSEGNGFWKKINSFEVSQSLSVAIAEQVKYILDEYKGEIK